MTADQLDWRYCAECARERAFEKPICVDSSDEDCSELACTACGAALTFGQQPAGQPGFVADAAA